MGWMRTNLVFGGRAKLLTAPRNAVLYDELYAIGVRLMDNPEELHRLLQEAIVKHRPELAGGIIEAMDFDFRKQQCEVLYSHPSFPVTALGDMPAEEPLIKAKGEEAA